MNTHSSLPPPSPTPFFEVENGVSKKEGRVNKFQKNLHGKSKS